MKQVIPWLLGVLSLVFLTACGQTVSDPKVLWDSCELATHRLGYERDGTEKWDH